MVTYYAKDKTNNGRMQGYSAGIFPDQHHRVFYKFIFLNKIELAPHAERGFDFLVVFSMNYHAIFEKTRQDFEMKFPKDVMRIII
jgi:hypothetical protein